MDTQVIEFSNDFRPADIRVEPDGPELVEIKASNSYSSMRHSVKRPAGKRTAYEIGHGFVRLHFFPWTAELPPVGPITVDERRLVVENEKQESLLYNTLDDPKFLEWCKTYNITTAAIVRGADGVPKLSLPGDTPSEYPTLYNGHSLKEYMV